MAGSRSFHPDFRRNANLEFLALAIELHRDLRNSEALAGLWEGRSSRGRGRIRATKQKIRRSLESQFTKKCLFLRIAIGPASKRALCSVLKIERVFVHSRRCAKYMLHSRSGDFLNRSR